MLKGGITNERKPFFLLKSDYENLPCLGSICVNAFEQHRRQLDEWQLDKTRLLFVHWMFRYPMTKRKKSLD